MILSEYIGEMDVSGNYDTTTTIGELLTDGGGETTMNIGYCDESNIPIDDEDINKVKDKAEGISEVAIMSLIQKAKADIIDNDLRHLISSGFIHELVEMFDYGYNNIEVFFADKDMNKIVAINDVMSLNGNGTKGGYIPFKKHIGKIVIDKKAARIPEDEVMGFTRIMACFDHRKLELVEHHYFSRNDPDVDYRTMSKKAYLESLFEEFFPAIHVDEMFGYDFIDNEIEEMLESMSFNDESWIGKFEDLAKEYKIKNPIMAGKKRVQLKLVA